MIFSLGKCSHAEGGHSKVEGHHLLHSSHPVGQSPHWLFSPSTYPFLLGFPYIIHACVPRVCTCVAHDRNEQNLHPVPRLMDITPLRVDEDNYETVPLMPAFVLSPRRACFRPVQKLFELRLQLVSKNTVHAHSIVGDYPAGKGHDTMEFWLHNGRRHWCFVEEM